MTTEAQHMQALALANEIRFKRADVKRAIRGGSLTIREVFEDPADYLATMPLDSLLRAVRGLGMRKIIRICNAAKVAPAREIGKLTVRQRAELLRAFETRCPRIAAKVA
jgi:hypothetical protein